MSSTNGQMPWKEGGSLYLVPKFVTVELSDGRALNFYPLRVSTAFELKKLSIKIAKALTVLLAGNRDDQSLTEHSHIGPRSRLSPDHEPEVTKQIIQEAISPELAQFRSSERARMAEEICEALLDRTTMLLMLRLVSDSLREQFKTTPSEPQLAEWANELDVPAALELIKGMLKANEQCLGPLKGSLAELTSKFVKLAATAVDKQASSATLPQPATSEVESTS